MKKIKCLVLALGLMSFGSVFANSTSTITTLLLMNNLNSMNHSSSSFSYSEHTHTHHVRESIREFFSNIADHFRSHHSCHMHHRHSCPGFPM